MTPGSRVMPTTPAAPRSLAYVLSQIEDGAGELRWRIVFRSGPGCSVKPLGSSRDAPSVLLDPSRPRYEEFDPGELPRGLGPDGEPETDDELAARRAAETPGQRQIRGALFAMEGVAEDRERYALTLPGERHVLFVAVLASDLAAYGLGR